MANNKFYVDGYRIIRMSRLEIRVTSFLGLFIAWLILFWQYSRPSMASWVTTGFFVGYGSCQFIRDFYLLWKLNGN
jgi:hypothetical protein